MAAALVALFIMGGCAGPGIPTGSVLRAEYQGHFKSEFISRNIIVRVYDAPDGSRPVSGELDRDRGDAKGTFYGQMKGSRIEARLEGGLGELTCKVAGEMAADGQTMAGTFKIDIWTGPPGTWEAKRK
jgi:hypothetical protein